MFLIGGGADPDAVRASHAPFVAAAGGGPIVVFVLDEAEHTDVDRWLGALRLAGADDVRAVVVSPRPATGGRRRRRCRGRVRRGRLDARLPGGARRSAGPRLPRDRPYAGYSAGAAIAATDAIVGGHRRDDGRDVGAEEAGEDLVALTVRPGLGLVPFAVDVHATQWGTLTRLVHAVDAGLVAEGWAVDNGTVLAAGDGPPRVEGLGSAYHVTRADARLEVEVVRAARPG